MCTNHLLLLPFHGHEIHTHTRTCMDTDTDKYTQEAGKRTTAKISTLPCLPNNNKIILHKLKPPRIRKLCVNYSPLTHAHTRTIVYFYTFYKSMLGLRFMFLFNEISHVNGKVSTIDMLNFKLRNFIIFENFQLSFGPCCRPHFYPKIWNKQQTHPLFHLFAKFLLFIYSRQLISNWWNTTKINAKTKQENYYNNTDEKPQEEKKVSERVNR